MKNPKLLTGLINKIKDFSDKSLDNSSEKIVIPLLGHLALLEKYMKNDPSRSCLYSFIINIFKEKKQFNSINKVEICL